MSSCLKRYSVRHELNTLDACWIAVDVWSNSSRCRKYRSTCLGRDAYMYDHCLRYRHDFARFYQLLDSNLSPTVIFAILREASSAPHHISSLTFLLRCTFRLQISLCNQSWRDWQPLYSVGCKLFCVCAGTLDLTRFSYWIDTLVLKLREILTAPVLHHPFLFKGKTNASSRGSRRISGAVAGEDQVKNSSK